MRVIPLVAVAVVLAGCGAAPIETPSPAAVTVTRELEYSATGSLDVLTPPNAQSRPVIVALHGCCGTRQDMFAFAHALAADGAVVFNADWRNATASYPDAYLDVACAVAFARQHASRFGGDPSRVTVAAWSDGAMVASAVAFAPDRFNGECTTEPDTPHRVDALVGLGGFYGWPTTDGTVPARYINQNSVAFFGGAPETAPTAWRDGNPYGLLQHAPDLQVVIVVGDQDTLRADAICFYWAAQTHGLPTSLVPVLDAGHQAVVSPRIPAGQRAVAATLAAAVNQPFDHVADVIPSCKEVQS